MYAIETNQLSKKYNDKTVVNKVDLKVKRGIVFGFLGKNGAGKSTFINIVTGLSQATSGKFKLSSSREKIGVLPDYSSLYDDLTALDHLIYFSKLLKSKKNKEELIKILEKVGLNDAINLKTKKFSFGMKKKLALAQTLVNDPEIIFLDEPTSGVDANSILTIHELILELAKKGTTIFFTSHNLDEVEKISDEVAIMDKGTIKLQGSIQNLKEHHEKGVNVEFKFLNELENVNFEKLLPNYVSDFQATNNTLYMKLDTREQIVKINKQLIENNIQIYEINIQEPTLEEIFVNTGN
ncbi:ABC transporter ATP-binding protein [Staphylococcus canis]|uniref:ABC transporter ATP-binding protein n=1 Tax=Staphylococcus canis TaxID=2724942 RepID=A0ABS0TB83_9STAP|nr:ABC transporter ATP-binding protein [Staphylococcus canis]MBI5976005.1 ABC transporter ATP-binding protein [Staphylococcus canis]